MRSSLEAISGQWWKQTKEIGTRTRNVDESTRLSKASEPIFDPIGKIPPSYIQLDVPHGFLY